ncbi:hypothetical protein [Intrasporangium calvum]|uniref:hypothetical protein n=1 Tax=Intrasporangium calvum TaxID=53358 RepID=UPI000DF644D2|nr:hypothetical protein [Intrasporangium calvum]AXG12540.1 hypothetical protein DN585_03045 [Intrasporangium calvum]
MKLDKAVGLVREAEEGLAKTLATLGGRHATEHDVYHMSHALAERCREHLAKLTPFAEDLGASLPDSEAGTSPGGAADTLRRMASTVLGRSEATGMMLVIDLRDAYLMAQRAEISWVILLQAAKAARQANLEQVATSCREEAEGTAKWLRTHLKTSSPQVFATD